jgi:hypothetical protein
MDTSNENLSKEERKRLKAIRRLEKATSVIENTDFSDVQITVLCVKYGGRYGREYVERLRNMVARHLTIPYEFACLTDDAQPIEGVRTIYQPSAGYTKLWWHKVHMFDARLPLAGRVLYFDLDVVIHNNINRLTTPDSNEFYGIRDFNRKFHTNWTNLNSSVMCWTHGTQTHIWDKFKENPREAQILPGDQDWIWKTSRDRIKFWPEEWIQSYKWEIRSRDDLVVLNGKRQFKESNDSIEPSPECCVTVFHGDPKPQDVKDKFVVDNWK